MDSTARISELDNDIKLITEAIVYAQELSDNKPYRDRYLKDNNPDAWLMKGDNEMHYILYTGAERFLTKNGFDTAGISPSKLKEKLALMKQQRSSLEASLRTTESDVNHSSRSVLSCRSTWQKTTPGMSKSPKKRIKTGRYEPCLFTYNLYGAYGDRTRDLQIANLTLSQLS